MDKVIFLDIDGVLNSEEFFIKRNKAHIQAYKEHGHEEDYDHLFYDLDPNKIQLLNDVMDNIMEYTGCEIVLSSSWRIFGLERINKVLSKVGFKYEVNHQTTRQDMDRGLQIKKFVDENDIKNYLVIDDEAFDIKKYVPNKQFVKTTWRYGLQKDHVRYIIDYFKN